MADKQRTIMFLLVIIQKLFYTCYYDPDIQPAPKIWLPNSHVICSFIKHTMSRMSNQRHWRQLAGGPLLSGDSYWRVVCESVYRWFSTIIHSFIHPFIHSSIPCHSIHPFHSIPSIPFHSIHSIPSIHSLQPSSLKVTTVGDPSLVWHLHKFLSSADFFSFVHSSPSCARYHSATSF